MAVLLIAALALPPAALIALVNAVTTTSILARGWDVEPCVAEVAFRGDRLAACEIEIVPAGSNILVTRKHSIVPGVNIVRDVAYVDGKPPVSFTIGPSEDLILSLAPDSERSYVPRQFRVRIPAMLGVACSD